MYQAIFLDFYGTAVYENGPVSYEVIKRIYQSGDAGTPEEIVDFWWKTFRRKIEEACGDAYQNQCQLALENFRILLQHFHSGEDPEALCNRMMDHWCKPPIYDDTKWFLEQVRLPVYFVSNSDNQCMEAALHYHDLGPAGTITSEDAKYAKPHPEIFRYALDKLGLRADQVIHMGDSLDGDVKCPESVGIQTILMNREKREVPEGIRWAGDFRDAMSKYPGHWGC